MHTVDADLFDHMIYLTVLDLSENPLAPLTQVCMSYYYLVCLIGISRYHLPVSTNHNFSPKYTLCIEAADWSLNLEFLKVIFSL